MESGDIVALLALALILVALGGLLVAAEAAVSRVSHAGVEDVIKADGRRGRAIAAILDDRARYVNVLLFLRLLCSTAATVLVTLVCVEAMDTALWVRLLTAATIMVLVGYLVLGVAPRTLAAQHPERVALAASGPARFLARILSPLTSLLILVGNALTPGKGYRQGPFASQAELRELLDQASAELIEEEERQMLHSVFELGDTSVREVMVPRTEMVWVEQSKTLRQALSLGLRSGFSRIPVVGESLDDLVGVMYLKDVARRNFENRASMKSDRVGSVMRSAYFVPDSKRADDLLRDMQASRTHLAIVIDEYGGTAGLVTIEDILEEIVGEIADEYDTAEIPEVETLGAGDYRVSARFGIDDLAELIDVDISSEEEGADSVGGLLASRLGVVPIPGSFVDVDGYRLTAESAAGRRNRIGTVLVTPLPEGDS